MSKFIEKQIPEEHIEHFTKLLNKSESDFTNEVTRWVKLSNDKLINKQTDIVEYTFMMNVFITMITKIQSSSILNKSVSDGTNYPSNVIPIRRF